MKQPKRHLGPSPCSPQAAELTLAPPEATAVKCGNDPFKETASSAPTHPSKSPLAPHVSMLESCKTKLAPLPSWVWLTGSVLPDSCAMKTWAVCPAARHWAPCQRWGGGNVCLLLPGFCRLLCQGRGWEQEDQHNDCCGSRTWDGEDSWVVPDFFWCVICILLGLSPKFRVHWGMWHWER